MFSFILFLKIATLTALVACPYKLCLLLLLQLFTIQKQRHKPIKGLTSRWKANYSLMILMAIRIIKRIAVRWFTKCPWPASDCKNEVDSAALVSSEWVERIIQSAKELADRLEPLYDNVKSHIVEWLFF